MHVLPVEADHVGEQPLGEPVLAHHPDGEAAALLGELEVPVALDGQQAVALHPGHRLAHRRAALVQPLGDPGAQRHDVLLDQLVDGPEVHLGGVDQVAHPAILSHRAVGRVFPRPGRVGVVPTTAVMWFRRDLRLADNPALLDACDRSTASLPLFVLDPALWGPAGVTRAGLPRRVAARARRLARGSVTRPCPSYAATRCARSSWPRGRSAPSRVHVAADYGPYGHRRDLEVEQALADARHRAGPHRVAVRRGAGPGAQPAPATRTRSTRRSPRAGWSTAGATRSTPRPARPGWRSTRPSTSPTRSCPPGSSSPRPARRSPAGGGRRTSRSTWPTTTTSGTAPTWTPPAGCRGT